jgi:hypothetical protein
MATVIHVTYLPSFCFNFSTTTHLLSFFIMAPFRGWFCHMIEPDETTISLTRPTPSSWRVIRELNEHVYQRDEEGVKNGSLPSYASTKLLCEDISNPEQQAMLRIYMQIPYVNTECDTLSSRAKQATNFSPPELIAFKTFAREDSKGTPKLLGYKEVQQNSTGRVGGGFLIYFAWQIVPGIRLGDYSGAKTLWGLEPSEREEIRAAFKDSVNPNGSLLVPKQG